MRTGMTARILPVVLVLLMVTVGVTFGRAEEERGAAAAPASYGEQSGDCRVLMAGIEQQNRAINQELRQIKREIALLNQNLEQPGMREIMAGVGYILGLFGIAAWFAARRQKRGLRED